MNQYSPISGGQVFLSYDIGDSGFARKLATLLTDQGYKPVDADMVSKQGTGQDEAVLHAIEDSVKVIFIVPSREGNGKNALTELGAARAMGKQIVAIMPDASRAWNSDVARIVTRSAVVDASRVEDGSLVDALALRH